MRIAAAQFNPLAGDLAGNVARITALAQDAAAAGAQLLVTPQGALSGYPCGDLLWRKAFTNAADHALQTLCSATADLDLHLLVGHPMRVAGDCQDSGLPVDPARDQSQQSTDVADGIRSGLASAHGANQWRPALYDAASLLHRGRLVGRYHRRVFSRHDPFRGLRHFQAGKRGAIFTIDEVAFGVLVGEDARDPVMVQQWCDDDAQVLLALDTMPVGIEPEHLAAVTGVDVRRRSTAVAAPDALRPDPFRAADAVSGQGAAWLVVNPVGAQDEFVFEGRTQARNSDGVLAVQAPSFEESLLVVDVRAAKNEAAAAVIFDAVSVPEPPSKSLSGPTPGRQAVHAADIGVEARIHGALVTGVRDFVRKNGFPGVLLGLSGGMDSALVLMIAVDALGPQQVHAVMMPSPYTADISLEDAREMARLLGVRYDEISIDDSFAAFRQTLAGHVPEGTGTTMENIQARIRGTLLMALSNHSGKLVLTAGNKSESAVGYTTLYGDMAGGLAVIKDVYKTMVWRLARWRNGDGVVIPPRIIERAPSAELAPGQLDQDSLPPYETLDAILIRHLEQGQEVDEIVAAGFAPDTVHRVVELVRRAEFKRHQAAPGIRVTQRPFDSEWSRFVTCGFPD